MLSVDEALSLVLDNSATLGSEAIGVDRLVGRRLAADVVARLTQPPFAASAMDGYAVRFTDAKTGARLQVVAESAAGAPSKAELQGGQAVRIFTGSVVPSGADHVVIQEDVSQNGDEIVLERMQQSRRNIRDAGIDFSAGDILAKAGEVCHAMHGSIFAAANIAKVDVLRRPKVALFSNGNELKDPGENLAPGEIINSSFYAIASLIEHWGGSVEYIGCAEDTLSDVQAFFERSKGADIIVPIGGASVGDYDFVNDAFSAAGGVSIFKKIAMRPGKPTWYGTLGAAQVLGLPGNPASSIVAAALLLKPLIYKLGGDDSKESLIDATLTTPIAGNGHREAFMRARGTSSNGEWVVNPIANQDSSLLLPFASANALIRRPPNDPARDRGNRVQMIFI